MDWLDRGNGGLAECGNNRKQTLRDGADLGDSTDFTTPRRVVARAQKSGALLGLTSGLLLCLCLGWSAELASAQIEKLKILTPLYARPGSE